MRPQDANGFGGAQLLNAIELPGLRIREALYRPALEIPAQPHRWATLCLTVDGGYEVDWWRSRLRCGPATLIFHPAGEVYGARVSDAGSRCLTVGIDPAVLVNGVDGPVEVQRLNATLRAPPRWLAYQLRLELELGDDLSAISVESIVVALVGELSEREALAARSPPAPWLERVREQIEDEFVLHHTLESLALTAGVHRVHLAREFRRRFGCTVGHYIRQRRVEFACHRLTASHDPLSEIAFDAGFADQSHFTNTFRQLVGTTPGQFRARLRRRISRTGVSRSGLIRFKTAAVADR